MSPPRIPPRPVEEWTDEVDGAVAALRAHGPGGPASRPRSNILGIYAWHPALVRAWLPFSNHWLPFSNHLRHSTLSDRIREMAIIRTTWLGFGEYEWAQHVRMSRAGGYLTDAEIDALAEGPAAGWAVGDAAVVRAVDELCGMKNLSDTTWRDLEAQFSREQLMDFVFTVVTYDMHCTAFNALGLELDAGMTGFPEDHRRGALSG